MKPVIYIAIFILQLSAVLLAAVPLLSVWFGDTRHKYSKSDFFALFCLTYLYMLGASKFSELGRSAAEYLSDKLPEAIEGIFWHYILLR